VGTKNPGGPEQPIYKHCKQLTHTPIPFLLLGFFFFFFAVLGFELRAYTLSLSTSSFFVKGFF
jgi:hypothetical protein